MVPPRLAPTLAAAGAARRVMKPVLSAEHEREFAARGFVRCPGVLPSDLVSTTTAAIDRVSESVLPDSSRFVGQYVADPALFPLYSFPGLERVAKFFLRTERVILQSSAILVTKPQGPPASSGALWDEAEEHVDIQYTLTEIDGGHL